MSKLNSADVKKEQAAAMWAFVKRCRQALATVAVTCVILIAVILLVVGIKLETVPFIVVIWLAMIAYPFIQSIWIKFRTGLWWHTLNAQANWIGIAGIMGLLLIMLLYFLGPLFEGTPVYGARIGYEPLVLLIILPLFRSAFKSSTRVRARNERVLYGEHWLSLGRLTFWDVLLFRIPHERA
jgi:hypothetical protein